MRRSGAKFKELPTVGAVKVQGRWDPEGLCLPELASWCLSRLALVLALGSPGCEEEESWKDGECWSRSDCRVLRMGERVTTSSV